MSMSFKLQSKNKIEGTPILKLAMVKRLYRKILSSNTSRLEAHVGFFRLLMKGIFGPYVLWPFDKVDFLISNAH